MFFEDSDDPVLNSVKEKQRLIAKQTGSHAYRFDIRLRGDGETPFFDD
jgi:protocatechuate 3,4-dioxygenase beta subunit